MDNDSVFLIGNASVFLKLAMPVFFLNWQCQCFSEIGNASVFLKLAMPLFFQMARPQFIFNWQSSVVFIDNASVVFQYLTYNY